MKKLIVYILMILATAGITGVGVYHHKDDIVRILHLDNKEEVKQEVNQGQDENQGENIYLSIGSTHYEYKPTTR